MWSNSVRLELRRLRKWARVRTGRRGVGGCGTRAVGSGARRGVVCAHAAALSTHHLAPSPLHRPVGAGHRLPPAAAAAAAA